MLIVNTKKHGLLSLGQSSASASGWPVSFGRACWEPSGCVFTVPSPLSDSKCLVKEFSVIMKNSTDCLKFYSFSRLFLPPKVGEWSQLGKIRSS